VFNPSAGVIEPFFPYSHSPSPRKNAFPPLTSREKWLYSGFPPNIISNLL